MSSPMFAVFACFSLAAAVAGFGTESERALPPQPAPAAADLHLRPLRPAAPSLPSAGRAHAAFWHAFEGQRYETIPAVLQQLAAAFVENPRDAQTALLLGHTHLWKAAERGREEKRDPTVVDHVVLAEHYFEQAHRLAPEDHRILGWLGSTRLSLGAGRKDDALRGEGDRMLDEAVLRHPQFNNFTAAFVRSSLPASDPKFHLALEQMWRNIEACSGSAPAATEGADVNIYELAQRADPVCANTEKAPHNFEGFILTLGDMLMKAGKEEQAIGVYDRAKLAPTYTKWPFRELLESRVQDAPENARRVRNGEPAPMVSGSAYSCVACHARR